MGLSRTWGTNLIPLKKEKKCFQHNCSEKGRKSLFTCKKFQVPVRICSMKGLTGNPGWALVLSPSKTNGRTNSCPKEQTGAGKGQKAGVALPRRRGKPGAKAGACSFSCQQVQKSLFCWISRQFSCLRRFW